MDVWQAASGVMIAIVAFPIWGALCWLIWEGSIKPRLIPKTEIVELAKTHIALYGKRAAEIAFIEEDRAWRYSETFEQAKWKRVRRYIDFLSR
jgi:hypothetical protein